MIPNNNNAQPSCNSVPCDGCKRRHIKCIKQDNSEVCSYCFRRCIGCTYLIVRNKRGPKTKVESILKDLEAIYPSNNNQNQQNKLNLRNSAIGGSVKLDEIGKFYQVQLNHQYQQQQIHLFQVNNLNFYTI